MSKAIEAMKEEGWEIANGVINTQENDFIGFIRKKKPNAIVDFNNFDRALSHLLNHELNEPNSTEYEFKGALRILLKAVQRVEA